MGWDGGIGMMVDIRYRSSDVECGMRMTCERFLFLNVLLRADASINANPLVLSIVKGILRCHCHCHVPCPVPLAKYVPVIPFIHSVLLKKTGSQDIGSSGGGQSVKARTWKHRAKSPKMIEAEKEEG
jgi:hypothetical protein